MTPTPWTRPLPGARLLRFWPLCAAAVVAADDLWLKRSHPGLVSGKLADLALCFFAPVVAATLVEWALWARATAAQRPFALPKRSLDGLVCGALAAYFAAIKLSPSAARLHVALFSALVPGRSFAAVADPGDLVALPLVLAAYLWLRRQAGGVGAARPATRS